jgi:hypothetical protein
MYLSENIKSKLAIKKFKTLENELKIIHNNSYDYSNTVYSGMNSKCIIICKEHGEFEQTMNKHYRGQGCPECKKERLKELKTKILDRDEFIVKANKVHNNKYDYSKSIPIGMNKKINIICKEHGEFEQKLKDHLNGKGCYECGRNRIPTEEFISKSKSIHGDKFDYSKTSRTNNNLFTVRCFKHGEFKVRPSRHYYVGKCPKCSNEEKLGNIREFFENKKTILYIILIDNEIYKIGLTTKLSVNERFPKFLNFVVLFEKEFEDGAEAWDLEQDILKKTKDHRFNFIGTKFENFGGKNELRTINPIDFLI